MLYLTTTTTAGNAIRAAAAAAATNKAARRRRIHDKLCAPSTVPAVVLSARPIVSAVWRVSPAGEVYAYRTDKAAPVCNDYNGADTYRANTPAERDAARAKLAELKALSKEAAAVKRAEKREFFELTGEHLDDTYNTDDCSAAAAFALYPDSLTPSGKPSARVALDTHKAALATSRPAWDTVSEFTYRRAFAAVKLYKDKQGDAGKAHDLWVQACTYKDYITTGTASTDSETSGDFADLVQAAALALADFADACTAVYGRPITCLDLVTGCKVSAGIARTGYSNAMHLDILEDAHVTAYDVYTWTAAAVSAHLYAIKHPAATVRRCVYKVSGQFVPAGKIAAAIASGAAHYITIPALPLDAPDAAAAMADTRPGHTNPADTDAGFMLKAILDACTRPQADALVLSLRGYKQADAAKLLGRSLSTYAQHLAAARKKAAAVALEYGYTVNV